jgi:DNA-binding NarL/FixJ family response regulator
MKKEISSTETYRILLADDHAIVRRGLRILLESQKGVAVCAEASDGTQAVELTQKFKPDLAILDLTMPGMSGLQATCVIRMECPDTNVLILSVHSSEEVTRAALLSGSLGYISKSDADKDLLVAVAHMRENKPYFPASTDLSSSKGHVREPRKLVKAGVPPTGWGKTESLPLTQRQTEVLRLLAQGKNNKEVAARLGISKRTAESHRDQLMRRTECKSFSELLRFAFRLRLVEP